MKYYIQLLFLLIITFSSCKRDKIKTDNYEIRSTEKEVENFDTFNIRFHTDSIFQLARVNFPIEGKSIDGFEKHNWTLENWEMMKNPVIEKSVNKDYEHSLMKSDSLVIEKYWIQSSGFKTERRFKKIENKWFLIYYHDVNL